VRPETACTRPGYSQLQLEVASLSSGSLNRAVRRKPAGRVKPDCYALPRVGEIVPNDFNPTEWIATAEAAALTGYTPDHLRKAIRQGS